ncbi:MAG: hypothetical protein V2I27_04420 [Erythrobacter sp.]|jgi:hypothetical protein|nr:hypothetical protein [Erythrobacter sp.]
MFEENKPFDRMMERSAARGRAKAGSHRDPLVGAMDEAPETSAIALRSGEAMRAIEWHELTARLNAARDLRRELRSESILCAGSSGASFGDAAERYFRSIGDDEPPVNLDALEGSKGSGGIVSHMDKDAARHVARGVAREKND